MAKLDKLIERFSRKPPPKDFKWDELVSLMGQLGFDLDSSGGGSHRHFVMRVDVNKKIDTYKPHPNGVLKAWQINEVLKSLKSWGILS